MDDHIVFGDASVAFEDGGKTFYYRTEDTTLKCGDEVIVPIGTGTRKTVGRIMRIELCFSGDVPSPTNQTKNPWYLVNVFTEKQSEHYEVNRLGRANNKNRSLCPLCF